MRSLLRMQSALVYIAYAYKTCHTCHPRGTTKQLIFKTPNPKTELVLLAVFLMSLVCPKAIISSRKSQVLQCELWDWDPGMGIQNDDFLGRSVSAPRAITVAYYCRVFIFIVVT